MDLHDDDLLQLYMVGDTMARSSTSLAVMLCAGQELGVPGFGHPYGYVERRAWPYIQRDVQWAELEDEKVRRMCR